MRIEQNKKVAMCRPESPSALIRNKIDVHLSYARHSRSLVRNEYLLFKSRMLNKPWHQDIHVTFLAQPNSSTHLSPRCFSKTGVWAWPKDFSRLQFKTGGGYCFILASSGDEYVANLTPVIREIQFLAIVVGRVSASFWLAVGGHVSS